MAELVINQEKFLERFERLHNDWLNQKTTSLYSNADALCIPFGTAGETLYSKSAALHLYLFGNEELTDSIIVITKNNFYFMSSTKKCNFVKQHLGETLKSFTLTYLEKTKDEGMNRENFNKLIGAIRKGNGKRLASLFKDKFNGTFIPQWMELVDSNQLE